MTLFKPRVDKVIFALTTGGLCVIIPIKYILFIIILLLDASYFNIISVSNEHDHTNTSLMNIHINKSIYHPWTYIIWTRTIAGHTLLC